MGGPAAKVGQVVIKEIGKRLSKLAAKKAGSRLVGHMGRSSRAWQKAFRHIRHHFKPLQGKPSHSVFAKKYRNESALKELISQAASNPSRSPITTKLTIGGQSIGQPAVIIERQFSKAIGTAGDEACHILRIVVDYTGRPITAFPVKSFIGSGAGGKTAAAATTAAITVATAGSASGRSPIDIYAELLGTERTEQQQRIDKACSSDGVVEWVIDFLVSPSCIAPDPHELISVDEVNRRVTSVTRKFSQRTGVSFDNETKANIRADVIAAWGMGYRME